jgi:DNA-binding LytR/AlgR family response regulator
MPFASDCQRSVTDLDLSSARSGIFTAGIARLQLDADNLRRFNDALQRVCAGHPPYTADQIVGAARRVLRAAAKRLDVPFIRIRMRRAAEIRAALVDAHWRVPAPLESVMTAIVAYLDDAEHALIPRDTPVIGQLDAAILVDAAMDALRAELDEYAEFCRFRHAEAARIGLVGSTLATDREHWRRECEHERLLEQQWHRIRNARYGGNGDAPGGFRIR